MSTSLTHQVSLLALAAFLVRWRRFLATVVLIVAVAVAVVSLIMPARYRSTAVVRGSETSSEGLGALLASKISVLGGVAGVAPALGEVPGELHVAILRSRWMTDYVVEKMNLRKAWRMEKAPPEDIVAMFKRRTAFELEPGSQTIRISADDSSPQRAQAIAQALVDALDARNQELRSTAARREREFIGQRLDEARNHLTELEDSLSNFQTETGMLNLEEQVKATISAAATLEAQRMALETELDMNKQIFDPKSPEVAMLRMRLNGVESALRRLAQQKSARDRESDLLLHLRDTPQQGLTYLRLMRDIEVQQLLVALLIQRYEQARIDEYRNTPTILRVDPPIMTTKRVWPKRGLMVGVAAIAAFVFGTAVALVIEFLRNAVRDPANPYHGQIDEIRSSWRRK